MRVSCATTRLCCLLSSVACIPSYVNALDIVSNCLDIEQSIIKNIICIMYCILAKSMLYSAHNTSELATALST